MENLRLHTLAFVLSLLAATTISVPETLAGNKTWTGEANDDKFSTSANWSPSGTPVNGDSLVFTFHDGIERKAENDLAGLSVSGLTFNGGSGSVNSGFSISGNPIILTGNLTDATTTTAFFNSIANELVLASDIDIIVPATAADGGGQFDNNLYLENISGSGKLTKLGKGMLHLAKDSPNYGGAIAIFAGSLEFRTSGGLGKSSAGTTVSKDTSLILCATKSSNDFIVPEPLTIGGEGLPYGSTKYGALVVKTCSGVDGRQNVKPTATFSGPITLTADAVFSGNIKITGKLSGPYRIISGEGSNIIIESSNNTSQTPNTGTPKPSGSTSPNDPDSQPNNNDSELNQQGNDAHSPQNERANSEQQSQTPYIIAIIAMAVAATAITLAIIYRRKIHDWVHRLKDSKTLRTSKAEPTGKPPKTTL